MKKHSQILAVILLILLLFVGLLLFAMGVGEYAMVRMIMDQISRDGEMVSFTIERHQLLRIPFLLIGGGFSLLGGLGLVFFSRTERLLRWFQLTIRRYWKQFLIDALNLWGDIKKPGFSWWEWLILGLLIILAFAGRWVWVEKPMMHDESYTFIAFAQRPFSKVISDYHLPNNHVLNSILIHILYTIFGNPSPVIVRLPALMAGVLCVPLAYLWARRQYGIRTAIVAAALVAYFPWLKLQSTNGRGYMLMAMFTLLMMILGERVRVEKNRAAWVLLILVTVLNFYTLPISLYPFGILGLWLLVSALAGDISAVYGGFWRFFRYLFVYGFLSACFTLLLYSPILTFGSGWNSFFNNPFVGSLDWSAFLQTLPIRLEETLRDWQMDVPMWFSILLAMGVIFSVAFHGKSKKGRISIQVCAVAALSIIFVIQRPNPWTRIWTYLLPMMLVWSAAGWFLLFEQVFQKEKIQKRTQNVCLGVISAIVVVLSISHLTANLQYFRGEMGQEETVTLTLRDRVTSKDIVFTSVSFGPAFWYYFDRYAMPMNAIVNPVVDPGWQNVYFVMDDRDNKNYAELLSGKAIAIEDCPADCIDLIFDYGHYRVYRCAHESGGPCDCMQH